VDGFEGSSPQLENELLSKLHSNPVRGFVPLVAVTLNVIDVEIVDSSFCTRLPLSSTADVISVSGNMLSDSYANT
jgi:hypothetical protein